MKLADYLETEKVTASHLASLLGVSVSTVTRLANGSREPGIVLMRKIATATNNLVMPNDFAEQTVRQTVEAAE